MIRNVVFDFGQVLIRFEPKYMVEQYVTDPDDSALLQTVLFDRLYWDPLDRGTITDEEVLRLCRTRLPARLHDVAKTIYDNWIYHLPEMDGMRELLTELKTEGRFRLLLLSNISPYFSAHADEIPILEFFEHCVFSGDCQLVKPEREIYEHLCRTGNIRPEETVFVDDSPINIAGAEAYGIRGYPFDRNVPKLRKFLSELR